MDTNLSDYFRWRGLSYQKMDDHKSAIADFDEAIKRDPASYDSYFARCFSRMQTEDSKGALSDFSKCVQLDPKNPGVYYNRALYRINFKVAGDFCTDLKKALALGFDQAAELLAKKCK